MSNKDAKQRPPTALGRALKEYIATHKGATNEKLAAMLDVDPRTISRWKNGETILTDPHELKRIADRLHLPYRQLGIPPTIYAQLNIEDIDTTVAQIWAAIDQVLITDARTIGENLLQQINPQGKISDLTFLRSITQAYNAVAYAVSINVRTPQVQQALDYYSQMEYFARLLGDETLVNIALTYQGDMLRRKKDLPLAIEYLEAARDTTPGADAIARGNAMQLLGRSYLLTHREQDFLSAMREAEELALATNQEWERSVKRYELATVYEEYARSYSNLGRLQTSLDYLEQAEKVKISNKINDLLLRVARAETLIRGGDIRNGEPLAVQAAIESREFGHNRHIERLYALKRYMSKKAVGFSKAERSLGEALEGPLEF